MSTTQVIDEFDIICGLKSAIAELECLQQAQLLKEQREKAISSPAVRITIPIQHSHTHKQRKPRSKSKESKRASSKDRKYPVTESSKGRECKDKEKLDAGKKTSSRLIFPEMRASVLYSRCCCLHRDGLQDECPLIQCQGQPECLTKPWAICPPGKYVRSRHPELYPPEPKDCTT